MSRWLYRPRPGKTVICQISGPWDEERSTRLPAQCCGLPADQIYKCEEVAAPGHRCQVGDHTILHERMGNGYACSAVEFWIAEHGGLSGWCSGRGTSCEVAPPARTAPVPAIRAAAGAVHVVCRSRHALSPGV